MSPEEQTKDRWRTPENILAFAREAMGGHFDLDPATDYDNPTQAKYFFTRAHNALSLDWIRTDGFRHTSRMWLNPPFSKLKGFAELLAVWLGVSCDWVDPVRQACFVGSYSLEAEWADILAQARSNGYRVRARIMCPSPRIRFVLPPEASPDIKQPGGYSAQVWVWSPLSTDRLADLWHRHVGGRVTIYEPSR